MLPAAFAGSLAKVRIPIWYTTDSLSLIVVLCLSHIQISSLCYNNPTHIGVVLNYGNNNGKWSKLYYSAVELSEVDTSGK